MILIYRHVMSWVPFEYDGKSFKYAKSTPFFILALTDTWQVTGQPVEWGVHPLMYKLQEMDNWRDDTAYERFCEERNRKEELRHRAQRNEIKARAYDMRRDFAKATNDINTSSIKKIDKRRLKDGYC